MEKRSNWQFIKDRTFHKALDGMVARFILHTDKRPSEVSLMEFMEWSLKQSKGGNE